jgi:hypothetical protein
MSNFSPQESFSAITAASSAGSFFPLLPAKQSNDTNNISVRSHNNRKRTAMKPEEILQHSDHLCTGAFPGI